MLLKIFLLRLLLLKFVFEQYGYFITKGNVLGIGDLVKFIWSISNTSICTTPILITLLPVLQMH
jgi:hypothetical protein